ncbi:MAG: selenide, water dikinase SelD, partial [Elainella sp. Prado103]|nr:selenide, water dikinase SelD [Elainella sp. Prado103]
MMGNAGLMQSIQPITTDLVFIGGGHSHAIALKMLGMQPLPGVRLTLISDVSHTPYSGMLPAYVAGLYAFDDCHIDLCPLSQFAGATLILDRAIGLDLQENQVILANHPPLRFDWLSIDIGSTPDTTQIPGAEQVTPVKPISRFLQSWDRLVERLQQDPTCPIQVAIVGGGAGGVELAMAVQARLQQVYQAAHQAITPQIDLIHRGDRLVPERAPWVGKTLAHLLRDRGVEIHCSETVIAVESIGAQKQIRCQSGLTLPCDEVLWVTQAAAAGWLAQSGLSTDERGFILVDDTLQSISHRQVFAAGDVATMVKTPRPKAGVFAVRQGKPLVQNLRRAIQSQPLQPFKPQQEFLILIGTADRSAIASRGRWGLGPHPWLWGWKDAIDRRFMQQFSNLPVMIPARSGAGLLPSDGLRSKSDSSEPLPRSSSWFSLHGLLRGLKSKFTGSDTTSLPMPCAGCGSKVGSTILTRTLTRLRQSYPMALPASVLIGLDAADDAAVLQLPADRLLVQTVDYFRAIVNDPFVFGQISTQHCLSDLFAMGATPHSALAIVNLPYATAAKLEETLYQLLSGVVQALTATGAVLIGGHTAEAPELALGLSCNGLAQPDRLWKKSGLQVGQALILTKALGIGTLFAAAMQHQAKGSWIEAAIESMLQSNQAAAACFRQYGATACTDITGFGLIGHLYEMLQASQVAACLNIDQIPVLPGALTTLQQGLVSSLQAQNLRA